MRDKQVLYKEDCFAFLCEDRLNGCDALKECECIKCPFYKTEEQVGEKNMSEIRDIRKKSTVELTAGKKEDE